MNKIIDNAVDILDAELVPEQLDVILEALRVDPQKLLQELEDARKYKKKLWGY